MKSTFPLLQRIILMIVISQPLMAIAADKILLFTNQYPPYQMSTDGGQFAHDKDKVTGICTDVVKLLMEKAGMPYQIWLRIAYLESYQIPIPQ